MLYNNYWLGGWPHQPNIFILDQSVIRLTLLGKYLTAFKTFKSRNLKIMARLIKETFGVLTIGRISLDSCKETIHLPGYVDQIQRKTNTGFNLRSFSLMAKRLFSRLNKRMIVLD